MSTPRRPVLEGTVGAEASDRRTQRALDQLHADLADTAATGGDFVADPASWVAPLPTTLQQAVTRIAAAIGPVP